MVKQPAALHHGRIGHIAAGGHSQGFDVKCHGLQGGICKFHPIGPCWRLGLPARTFHIEYAVGDAYVLVVSGGHLREDAGHACLQPEATDRPALVLSIIHIIRPAADAVSIRVVFICHSQECAFGNRLQQAKAKDRRSEPG